jgi:hypothetical protein
MDDGYSYKIDRANAIVEACAERREEAIEYVLHACIHNVSDAINELAETSEAYGNAIEAWYEQKQKDEKFDKRERQRGSVSLIAKTREVRGVKSNSAPLKVVN